MPSARLHSYKVGYDEQFSQVNPGQILMHELLRELCETRRCHCLRLHWTGVARDREMVRREIPGVPVDGRTAETVGPCRNVRLPTLAAPAPRPLALVAGPQNQNQIQNEKCSGDDESSQPQAVENQTANR